MTTKPTESEIIGLLLVMALLIIVAVRWIVGLGERVGW